MRSKLRRAAPVPENTLGRIQVDRRTKDLTKRLRPGEIAIIDHEDIDRVAAEAGLRTEPVDVDADPDLQAEYGDRVPVVLLDGREHSYFTVDVPRLRRDLGLG